MKNENKTSNSTKKITSTKTPTTKIEKTKKVDNTFDELELEDEEVRRSIERRKKEKSGFEPGMPLGTKIAIVVVIVVIAILLFLKGCVKGNYRVRFDTDGGTEVSEQIIKVNEKVSAPENPTKDGFEFEGWYVGDKKYDFNSVVKSNLVLKAKWESLNKADVTGVELDQLEMVLMPGDTAPLIAKVTPDDAKNTNVTWASSDEEVATVDKNGTITAKNVGHSTITVITEEGEFSAKCVVVVSNDVVKVTGITLNESNISIGVDETKRVTASITPIDATNNGVTWTSDDDSIASVSNIGVITGRKEGSTTIIAKTKDGGYEAKIKVKVEKITAKSISLNKTSLKLNKGKTSTLIATVLPKNAVDKVVEWKSDNTAVATVDKNGKVTAIKEGTAKITAMIKIEDTKIKATCEVTVSKPIAVTGITIDGTTSKSITLKKGETVSVKVAVLPSNAVDKNVTWSITDSNVATISKGVITAHNVGHTTLTVKTKDGGYEAKVYVNVIESSSTTPEDEEKGQNESVDENKDDSATEQQS